MIKSIFKGVVFFLFTTGLFNHITAQSHMPNPERGLRFEEMAKIPSLQFPWDVNRKLKTQTWCTDLETTLGINDGHVKLAQLYIYLTDFAHTNTISQSALDTVQSIFNGVRKQGFKLVLRFAYTYDDTGGYVYPPMDRILGHLDQLKPLIQANIDVIYVLQAGIIGLWGEWHNYNNTYTQADKNNLLKKLLEVLPQDRQTMVRLPSYKNATNLTKTEKARVGFHNDFFTDDQHVNANAWGYLATSNYDQVQLESLNLMVEGEMPYDGPTSTDHLNYVLDPIKAIKQLKDHRYNSLSLIHNYKKTFAGWKASYLTKSLMDQNNFSYDPTYFNSGKRTVYDYVADYLGYRLYVDHNNTSIVDLNNQINCNIKLINYGFSALHNPREVYLVLTTSSNTLVDLVKVNADPKTWHTGIVNELEGILSKPAELKNYKIGLWMPDFDGSQTRFDARYAIQICNNHAWLELKHQTNKVIGMNVLVDICDSVPTYCDATGVARDRYIKSLSTTRGLSNISFTNNTSPLNAYLRHTNTKVEAVKDSSFVLKIANTPNTKWDRINCWVDWNRNGDFSDDEKIFYLGNAATDNSNVVLDISKTITIPHNAVVGTTVMRIRFHDAWIPDPGPCDSSIHTTTFDFYVEINDENKTSTPKILNDENNVIIYPNPAAESITLFSDKIINHISIYSLVGELVQQINNINTSSLSLNIASFKPGVYFFQFDDEEGHVYHNVRFIKY